MPTVLVVEDEWVIAEVLAVTLADAGYQVITAANGRQALASLAETRPDVIVTDTMMPILDGPGLLAALAADPDRARFAGRCLGSWDLMREYGFTDADGTRPDWGAVDLEARESSLTEGHPAA